MDDGIQRRWYALAAAGLDPDQEMMRVPSYSNEVWLGERIAVRISHRQPDGPAPQRLLREAAIVARLAPAARYPAIIAAGSDEALGIAWLITRRVSGVQLGRAWATMAPSDRERAIGQLADSLAALHSTAIEGIDGDIQPPHTLPLAALLDLVERAIDAGEDRALLREVGAFVQQQWSAFDGASLVLAHGDPHLENVVWDGSDVTAVLDLEWARPTFLECDLEILLSVADHPALFAAEDYERSVDAVDYAAIPRWLAAASPPWFAHPRLVERLELLLVSRTLGALVDAPGSPIRIAHLRAALAGDTSFRGQLSEA